MGSSPTVAHGRYGLFTHSSSRLITCINRILCLARGRNVVGPQEPHHARGNTLRHEAHGRYGLFCHTRGLLNVRLRICMYNGKRLRKWLSTQLKINNICTKQRALRVGELDLLENRILLRNKNRKSYKGMYCSYNTSRYEKGNESIRPCMNRWDRERERLQELQT